MISLHYQVVVSENRSVS